jgi:hypothetical protein
MNKINCITAEYSLLYWSLTTETEQDRQSMQLGNQQQKYEL